MNLNWKHVLLGDFVACSSMTWNRLRAYLDIEKYNGVHMATHAGPKNFSFFACKRGVELKKMNKERLKNAIHANRMKEMDVLQSNMQNLIQQTEAVDISQLSIKSTLNIKLHCKSTKMGFDTWNNKMPLWMIIYVIFSFVETHARSPIICFVVFHNCLL